MDLLVIIISVETIISFTEILKDHKFIGFL